jgi:ferredoxin
MKTGIKKNNGLVYLRDVTTLHLIDEKCIGCGMCETVCPHRVITICGRKALITERDLMGEGVVGNPMAFGQGPAAPRRPFPDRVRLTRCIKDGPGIQ